MSSMLHNRCRKRCVMAPLCSPLALHLIRQCHVWFLQIHSITLPHSLKGLISDQRPWEAPPLVDRPTDTAVRSKSKQHPLPRRGEGAATPCLRRITQVAELPRFCRKPPIFKCDNWRRDWRGGLDRGGERALHPGRVGGRTSSCEGRAGLAPMEALWIFDLPYLFLVFKSISPYFWTSLGISLCVGLSVIGAAWCVAPLGPDRIGQRLMRVGFAEQHFTWHSFATLQGHFHYRQQFGRRGREGSSHRLQEPHQVCRGWSSLKSTPDLFSASLQPPSFLLHPLRSVIFCEAVAIYGVIVAIILQTKVEAVKPLADGSYSLAANNAAYAILCAGSITGWANLACGLSVGVVGSAAALSDAANATLFVKILVVEIFASALGLFGVIIGIIMAGNADFLGLR